MDVDNYAAITVRMIKLGIAVFPVAIYRNAEGAFAKRPCVPWKEFQHRSPTLAEFERMFRKHRYVFAAGIPTGKRFFVVDADNAEAIRYLKTRGLPVTWCVCTRRGHHYYFRTPNDFIVRNSARKIYPGVDVRGLGGYVGSPYSSFQIGRCFEDRFFYRWHAGCSPADVSLADAPSWLLAELRAIEERKKPTAIVAPRVYSGQTTAWARKAFDLEIHRLATATDGQKNAITFEVARRLGQLVAYNSDIGRV